MVSAVVSIEGSRHVLGGMYTFHVSFALKHDECIPSAATLFVAHNPDAFNTPKSLKLAP